MTRRSRDLIRRADAAIEKSSRLRRGLRVTLKAFSGPLKKAALDRVSLMGLGW